MLKWHDHYYVGESVRDESAVREKLDAGKPVPGIYLVTFSDNPHNILEIIPAVTLFQKTAARPVSYTHLDVYKRQDGREDQRAGRRN